MDERDQKYISIVPAKRQLAHQSLEFYAFLHFTVNTFTGKEWGDGTEEESIFDPTDLDAMQWVKAVKSAGMRGIILTCKHHDGFCLWPSKYTKHTVANSPYKDGKGDIVKEVSDACREEGIAFGVYLSPWDRNQETYGYGESYNDYFVNQLSELLTGYGPVFSVWFDGACGEGSNGKKQIYDWERYYSVIRELQPGACISVCGPDIRWCGNEAGDTRESEWSVVPKRTSETEMIAENSQQADDEAFRDRKIKASDQDLGSRTALEGEEELIWYPAEVNTSIRPGWFYHEEEDERVRSLQELLSVYFHSVGGNACFLLNIPPDRRGRIHENDCRRLAEIGEFLRDAFRINLLDNAKLSADSEQIGKEIEHVRMDDYESEYQPDTGKKKAEIIVEFHEDTKVSYLVMKENIKMSQRIEAFEILDDEGQQLYKGTVIGYKKIIPLSGIFVRSLKIRITDSRVNPVLSFLGVY